MTLGKLLGSPVSEKDFTDDRLGILVKCLYHLNKPGEE